MGHYAELRTQLSFDTDDGGTQEFEIGALARGEITKLLAKQTGGDADGFSFNLYSAAEADRSLDDSMYLVMPNQSVSSPTTTFAYFAPEDSGGRGYHYARPQPSIGAESQKLFLALTVGGSGVKTFDLTLGVLPVDSF